MQIRQQIREGTELAWEDGFWCLADVVPQKKFFVAIGVALDLRKASRLSKALGLSDDVLEHLRKGRGIDLSLVKAEKAKEIGSALEKIRFTRRLQNLERAEGSGRLDGLDDALKEIFEENSAEAVRSIERADDLLRLSDGPTHLRLSYAPGGKNTTSIDIVSTWRRQEGTYQVWGKIKDFLESRICTKEAATVSTTALSSSVR